jgi:hypothetical protein
MNYKLFTTLFIFLVLISNNLSAQWGYTLYGYVKTDVMLDTRQTVSAREGHVLLYPANRLEANGEDANEGLNFNILSIQSRFGFKVAAPDFLGAKSTGKMESEFFGSTNNDVGSLRLRHAYVKLDWGTHEVLAGHTWHPLFVEDCYPQVISFNTGIPFVAFGRNPMVKYTFKPGDFRFHLSAITERDFQSTGPDGETANYVRNSGIPMVNLGINYIDQNIYLAANACYKELKPRLITEKGFKEDDKSQGIIANVLARYSTKDFFVTGSVLFGQNTYDLLMIGGYAVSAISPDDGKWQYTPVDVASAWVDAAYGDKLNIGFFGGYCKNLGAENEVVGKFYSRGKDIDYIYRLSPRISYKLDQTQLAAEFEYTTAAYGTNDKMGKVLDSKEVANLRILLSAYIYF